MSWQIVSLNGRKQHKKYALEKCSYSVCNVENYQTKFHFADDLGINCYSEQACPHSPSAVWRMDMKKLCVNTSFFWNVINKVFPVAMANKSLVS